MKKNNIKDNELFFDLEANSLLKILKSVSLKKLSGFSDYLSNLRSKSVISKKLLNILKEKSNKGLIFRMKTSFKLPNLVRFLYAK